ncbi:zinc-dependent metalloprotease [Emticicia sp. SJ17W-69]|uniref:zinc-dependent metalloprotease n=1 Tax=Emticicia sp. SJ17W-69 TaxID=3421657 RepID=UPI003EBCB1A4
MRNFYSLFILLLLILGQGESLFAQLKCGMPSPTEQEKQASFAQYQAFLRQKTTQKQARVNTYKVAVKANIITSSNPSTPTLSENDIQAIIANANTYLQNINVELFLYNSQVFPVVEDKFYNFKMADESELRRKYDVQNAINIYFVRSITLKDSTILSGFAPLPNSSNNSNKVFYSYFDRSSEDFENLKNKTFLHEIGHYFGLFHTFQDSNHPDISKREVVTRGVGSNCIAMGDQLCDTSADPFERLPQSTAFNCDQNTPANIQDANGETFTPPNTNIMSYYQKCGNVFTEQQYQKMQASFGIRFSPLSEYQIVTRSANFVSIGSLAQKVYCVGDSLKISYDLEGLFETNNQLFVEISDKFSKNYQKIEAKFTETYLEIKLPNDLQEGDDYRVRVTATRPETISSISENFAIRTPPTASITANNTLINAGESINLSVSLGGSGTWSFNLSDGTSVKDIRSDTYQISKTLSETSTFSILSVENVCGEGSKGNSITINVVQPQIRTESLSTTTLCQGQIIKLGISILGTLSPDNQLIIQISDNEGKNYIDLPTQVSLFNLSTQIPTNLPVGSGYRLKILAKKSQLFSSPIGPITIVAPPPPPKIASNINYCQNAVSPLVAEGTNLKWFLNEYDIKSFASIIPPTDREGTFAYYVSQTDAFGCEGPKAKTNVTIRFLATAMISGDRTMLIGDSTLLNINIMGDLPASFTLSDGQAFITDSSPFILNIKPLKSTTYTLKEVNNSCGLGNVSGSAKITILEPLANEEINSFKVFPNPSHNQLIVELLANSNRHTSITLIDLNGKILQEKSINNTGNHQETLDISQYATGNYFLKITIDRQFFVKKIVIDSR